MRWLAVLVLAGCVDGREFVMPTEPDWALVCEDSVVVDTTRVCWGDHRPATIVVVIENPLVRPDSVG